MTSQTELARKFRKVYSQTNFMTPEVLRYERKGRYICELSCSTWLKNKLFGVTVITENGEKCSDLNECFSSQFDAANYINGLTHMKEE